MTRFVTRLRTRVGCAIAMAMLLAVHDGVAASREVPHLPPLAQNGHLPPGMHRTGFADLRAKYGGTPRRTKMLAELLPALRGLRKSGLSRVYIGGSFASAKPEPGDIDMLLPRQHDVDWGQVVRVAKKTARQHLNYYGARRIVTDIMDTSMTEAQRSAWQLKKPDFVEFFSQNRRGEQVGVIVVDLDKLDE